ncbi:MAG: DUF3570 domain-containing protein [Bacteroidales bacterium]|jgi:hypothetical protein|nr:DUF3570 domain-containing protein [Bacteroidales bacterium]
MKACIFSLFLLTGFALSAQDSAYIKRKLSETEINLLFSYYTQDGEHSAVTGGRGTEKLLVYAPKFGFSHEMDSTHTILFDAGIDFITSASTDNIDFNMSSASRKDAHVYGTAGYSHFFKRSRVELGATGSFGLESDFLSGGFSLWFYHPDRAGMTSYYAGMEAFFDDMRWGRLSEDDQEPLTLVYPSELRDTNWFDIYMRYSYNIELGYERVINRRTKLGVYPGMVIQNGLLSTSFHRVYFEGENLAVVENLPFHRIKLPLGIRLNTFLGTRFILNTYYRIYTDDFGIFSNTIEMESQFKINPFLAPVLSFRFYQQSASKYFKPYQEHVSGEKYYTSDYDLSRFHSLKAGAGIRYAPLSRGPSGWGFEEMELNYDFYWRSDGLQAHIISTFFGIGR